MNLFIEITCISSEINWGRCFQKVQFAKVQICFRILVLKLKVKSDSWIQGWAVWHVIWLKEINPQQRIQSPPESQLVPISFTWTTCRNGNYLPFIALHRSTSLQFHSFIHWGSADPGSPGRAALILQTTPTQKFPIFFRRTPWNREKMVGNWTWRLMVRGPITKKIGGRPQQG